MVRLVARADKRFEKSFDAFITTMNGTAIEGEDYDHFSGIIRFDVSSQTGVVNLTTLPDDKYEGVENFMAVLTLAGTMPTGVNVGAQDTATIDIMEATGVWVCEGVWCVGGGGWSVCGMWGSGGVCVGGGWVGGGHGVWCVGGVNVLVFCCYICSFTCPSVDMLL